MGFTLRASVPGGSQLQMSEALLFEKDGFRSLFGPLGDYVGQSLWTDSDS